MKSVDPGILPHSTCFSFTPPETAKGLFFYPTWCGHYYCNENYYMRRQSYPPLLVVYIRQGVFRIEYRGEACRAQRGDVVLLDCTEPHYYHAEDGLEFLYMHFDGSNAHALSQHVIDTQGWLIRRESNMMVGKLLYDMVDFYERGGIETPFESSMRIYRMFELLLSPTREEREAGGPVDDAITYIRSNVGKQITLEELAGVARLSVFYFSHCFKQQTGFAPMDYVINTRIEQAKILLVRTSKSVAEIAYEVGYASSGSLINIFVKRVGVSPKQYRRDHNSISMQPE
ncbi:AraC family transcriptional regulator [Intestinibacillus massiliensis]|uniref:helix-turn-helix domain-containing protein n=1 Tax=Intestinibacillus massiliensis TaxID=1871029 RepID=UPI000B3513CB|nr:AraC family transcriptional regulator [Intestinibacillus massiliensis]MCB6366115.1 AraC family transcriptional regulator [Intestinibacillus massiliensis]